jgi:hypothetical protein
MQVIPTYHCCTCDKATDNRTDYDVILFIWDVAESTVTMMAACIPTLRVLLRDTKTPSRPSQLDQVPDLYKLSYRGLGVKMPPAAHELKVISTEDSGESGKTGGSRREGTLMQ